jgi:hypothetical protein
MATRRRNSGRDRQARWRKRQLLPGKVVVLRNQEVDIDALGRAFVNAEWLAAHGLTNNRKGLLSDRLARGDVIGGVEEALIDLRARHEAVDLDRMGARDLDGVELLIGDDEILALRHLVAAGFVFGANRRAGLFIDELLA